MLDHAVKCPCVTGRKQIENRQDQVTQLLDKFAKRIKKMEGRSESNYFPSFFMFTIINMFLFNFLLFIRKRKSEYPFIVETKTLFKHLDFELIPQIS